MDITDFHPNQVDEIELARIRSFEEKYADLAEEILTLLPSAHRTAALRLLLESKMTVVHGISHP